MNVKTFFQLLVLTVISPASMAAGNYSDGHRHDSINHSAHWMAPPQEAARKNPVAATAESIASGARLFQRNCAVCHGLNAEGNGPAGTQLNPLLTNLRAMSGHHSDGDYAYKIRRGSGAMPSWRGKLDDTSIWHLVNYIQSLGKQSKVR